MDKRAPEAEVAGGKWDKGGLLKAVAGDGDTEGGTEVPLRGAEGAGDSGTKGGGADGCTGGRDGWGVEYACGGKDSIPDTLGDEKELVAAK